MFSKAVRNKRILTASVRAARADVVAVRAEKAIKRRDAAVAEVKWLRNAPVKDGEPGADLPSEADIKAYVADRVSSVPVEQDDDDSDEGTQPSVNDEQDNSSTALFSE
jgi:hypothetical protein